MKISYRWLAGFIAAADEFPSPSALAELLTGRGFEVDESRQTTPCEGVVVGKVSATKPHPNAKRLSVCQVLTSDSEFNIVCGAPNVRAGLMVAVALPGAIIGSMTFGRQDIRGVFSEGMICSAQELGIGDDADGILELPNAELGDSLASLIDINDTILEVGITPNRGDCLSHLGLAREVAAACRTTLIPPVGFDKTDIDETYEVSIDAPDACPLYGCVIVRDVDNSVATPARLLSRITQCGGRGVNAAVDITNYVLLETGQPLHAFDLDKLHGALRVRYAKDGEKIALLDGKEVSCDSDTLMIADEKRAIAMAGVMGGSDTGVDENTRNILLEGAFFTPQVVRGKTRRHNLNSEAAFHFERGVDYRLAPAALRRAAELLTKTCGGRAGPVLRTGVEPMAKEIKVQGNFIRETLGMPEIKNTDAVRLLADMAVPGVCLGDEITVNPPSWRFDLQLPVDIVEEVARTWGYERIIETVPVGGRNLAPIPSRPFSPEATRRFFAARGFYEIISYSFVPPAWEKDFGTSTAIRLKNPISEDMSVMRTSLLGGLMNCARFNISHKQGRIRLFEIGRCFFPDDVGDLPQQPQRLAGLVYGPEKPAQWGENARTSDFYDLKGVLESFLGMLRTTVESLQQPPPYLHPAKAGKILWEGESLGIFGEAHPRVTLDWDFRRPPLIFELDFERLYCRKETPAAAAVSRFPVVSRDLAILAPEGTTAADLLAAARRVSAPVSAVDLFDFYVGGNIPLGKKSFGLRVTMQGDKQNLKDEDINAALDKIIVALADVGGLKRGD